MTKKKQVREQVDISDQINNLHIEKAIDLLKGLSADYPDAWLNLTREYEYGESYEKLYLEYNRDQTPLEIELDATDEKCRQLQALKSEAAAFKRNGAPYPRRDEVRALAAELGYLALAPQSGMLRLYEGEIVVADMMHGWRRRDGEWVMRMMRGFEFTDDPDLKASGEALEQAQAESEKRMLDVSWVE